MSQEQERDVAVRAKVAILDADTLEVTWTNDPAQASRDESAQIGIDASVAENQGVLRTRPALRADVLIGFSTHAAARPSKGSAGTHRTQQGRTD